MGLFNRKKQPHSIKITMKTDDSIKEWANRPAPILGHSTPEDMLIYDKLPYTFENCPTIYHPYSDSSVYLIGPENQATASKAILDLNDTIASAKKENPAIPDFKITKRHLRFSPDQNLESDDFSCFILNPKTNTEKPSKYPLQIRVRTLSHDAEYKAIHEKNSQAIHGTIFYLADGSVGKIELSCWLGQKNFPIKWTK